MCLMLNIKREYLEALEKDEYDAIPGAVFVKGFLRNYGNFLELDGVAWPGNIRKTSKSGPRSRKCGLLCP